MRVGFIGFGEAASAIAAGLSEAGLRGMAAFDSADSPALQERAQAAGVEWVNSLPELVQSVDIILSMVTAAVALPVAQAAAPYVRSGAVYADLNSCSPQTKREIGKVLEGAGCEALFACVSVMAAVPPWRHRVPMVADGPGARPLQATLSPYGMRIEVMDGPVGVSAVLKMCRSVLVKGLEALFLESLLAAESADVTDQVLKSLDASFPQVRWGEFAEYLLRRNQEHGKRRAQEMKEAALTLQGLGVEPLVTEGAAQRLEWSAKVRSQTSTTKVLPCREWLRALLSAVSSQEPTGP
ncbi:DUF1932 domain-containing protein [Alicyclobacillus shizuokensis]|uniref:DUF1932 domain-containing protein n=1 Tax=Alicyclobacillus shizuokensis TaxID=392014 RepID=UPI0008341259|nr:DUF1932 domain-containing protein [Alicyclobacillus shizuokensis]